MSGIVAEGNNKEEAKMIKTALVLAFVAALLTGCAVASFSSFKDPAYGDHPGFKKVVVYADKMGLEERQAVETKAVEKFTMRGVAAVKAIDLFPPMKTYDLEHILSALKANGIDAALIISLDGQQNTTSYVPQFGPSTTTGTINTFGNTTTFNSQTYAPPGGFYVQKPNAVYSAALYEIGKTDPVWLASGRSGGGSVVSYKELALAASREVVAKLFKDGLFKASESYWNW